MLLRLRNILQKFITKIESVLDLGLVWGCVQNPFESKRRKKINIFVFLEMSKMVMYSRNCCVFFLRKADGRLGWSKSNVQFVWAKVQAAGYSGQNTMHARMYNLQKRDAASLIVENNLSGEPICRMRRLMSFSCKERELKHILLWSSCCHFFLRKFFSTGPYYFHLRLYDYITKQNLIFSFVIIF